MTVSDATWLDESGHVRLVGQLDSTLTGLPVGWTEDASNPANVATNGGALTCNDGTNDSIVQPDEVQVESGSTNEFYRIKVGEGVKSTAPTGVPCFAAFPDASATVALDGGGLGIANVGQVGAVTCALTPGTPGDDVLFCNAGAITGFSQVVPNVVPAITGALSTVLDAAAKDVLTSIVAQLVALGLVTDGTT